MNPQFVSTQLDMDGYVELFAEQCAKENEALLKKNVQKAGRTSRDYLKDNSPKKTGGYRRGWAMRSKDVRPGLTQAVVYNRSKPGLTHLLEKGHMIWLFGVPTGRRSRAIPHIAPAYEKGKEELQ